MQRTFEVDVFLPISTFAHLKGGRGQLDDRRHRSFELIGRLPPGATPEQAQAKFDVLAAQFQQQYPTEWTSEREGRSVSRMLQVISESESRIPALFGSAGIVSYLAILVAVVEMILMIACANLANLLLARATAALLSTARLSINSSELTLVTRGWLTTLRVFPVSRVIDLCVTHIV